MMCQKMKSIHVQKNVATHLIFAEFHSPLLCSVMIQCNIRDDTECAWIHSGIR